MTTKRRPSPSPSRHGRAPQRDAEWTALCKFAHETMQGTSEDVRALFLRITNEVADFGELHQVPPLTMAAGAAVLLGGLAMAQVAGNAHANEELDAFIDFVHAAVHVTIAHARIQSGWTPAGPS